MYEWLTWTQVNLKHTNSIVDSKKGMPKLQLSFHTSFALKKEDLIKISKLLLRKKGWLIQQKASMNESR